MEFVSTGEPSDTVSDGAWMIPNTNNNCFNAHQSTINTDGSNVANVEFQKPIKEREHLGLR